MEMLHAIASHLKKINILEDDVKNKEADLVKLFTHVKLCFFVGQNWGGPLPISAFRFVG